MQATTNTCKMLGIPAENPETPAVISAIDSSISEQNTPSNPKHTSEEHDNAVCSTSSGIVDDSNNSNLLDINCDQSTFGQNSGSLQNLSNPASSCSSTSSAVDDPVTKQPVTPKVILTPKRKNDANRLHQSKIPKVKSTFSLALIISKKVAETLRKLLPWQSSDNLKKYNSLQLNFIKSLFSDVTGEDPKWTFANEVVALTLYNRNPRSYGLLSEHVKLPPKPTLEKFLLRNVPFETGINKALFDQLKTRVSKMTRKTKITKLMFDEIPLSPDLSYCPYLDYIIGFEDLGSLGRANRFADHALVFMVQGLNTGWKQPVAYFFAEDAVKPEYLKVLISEVVSNLLSIGLEVVCTVCEARTNNMRAIELLKNGSNTDKDSPFFIVDSKRVVVLFDPPHLLISTRDAFAKYTVRYEDEGTKIAKFKYLLMTYELDSARQYRMLLKIREPYLHINRYKKLKTKVSVAAKTLSHKMAATVYIYSEYGYKDDPVMKSEGLATAQFVSDINRLFDSFNAGGMKREEYTPPLRHVLARKSPHGRFWNDMLPKVQSWEFLDDEGVRQEPTVPFKEGYISNIRGMPLVWERCRRAGFHCLRTRMLNQEPIKQLFSAIRLYGDVDGDDLTPSQFVSALKTSLFK